MQQTHDSMLSLQAQPQEQPCDCSTRISTPEAAQVDKQYFESWSSGGQAVQQQVSGLVWSYPWLASGWNQRQQHLPDSTHASVRTKAVIQGTHAVSCSV